RGALRVGHDPGQRAVEIEEECRARGREAAAHELGFGKFCFWQGHAPAVVPRMPVAALPFHAAGTMTPSCRFSPAKTEWPTGTTGFQAKAPPRRGRSSIASRNR